VDDSCLVGVEGGVADLVEGGEFLPEGDGGGFGPCIEGGTVDEFHGDPASGGALAGCEDPGDGGVFEGRGDFGFPFEAEAGGSAVVPWGEELEGDGPHGAVLDGAPDEAEVAATEEGIDDVSTGFRGGRDFPLRGGGCRWFHGGGWVWSAGVEQGLFHRRVGSWRDEGEGFRAGARDVDGPGES